ncbi:hypothetical protein RQM47_15205 [Rubrivirga sp. S365]|uniref:N-acetylmuramoyl-L-alanine amidase n=1 Tax=Rubrivirga litoralis TaxID=3075598 RepID=A0ABU3BT69_9BACT|nr:MULTISPECIES: hypothetical protein [unclassified Rubrivirga]MDT0632493.1 hypothetical protein [Rubrivirga sp. F394]MDT7857993.1 hypothetical protein [Rubrivirga sp. S365]
MRLAVFAVPLVAVAACAQPASPAEGHGRRADSAIVRPAPPTTDSLRVAEEAVPLGDDVVTVRVWTAPIPDPLGSPGFETFPLNALNLHDDEGTSVEAALAVLRERGGRVVELVHSGERNVTFTTGGRTYTADPNRMFTAAGRARTLAALSEDDRAGREALEAFADRVLALYAAVPPAVVVTLHDNTADGYSAASYGRGGEYEADAAAVTVHDGTDPDDFFFVTDRDLYDLLVDAGFNAVLQDNDAATDDGSLSVWAAREGTAYVNVEAQRGHLAEQTRMIAALVDVLSDGP